MANYIKRFIDLKEGDEIYYYDHCRIRKQIVKSINISFDTEMKDDFWGRTYIDKKCVIRIITTSGCDICFIYVGYDSIDKIPKYEFDDNNYVYDMFSENWNNSLRRFSDKRLALAYLNKLKEYRRNRMNKFLKKYFKEAKIYRKYETTI